MPLLKTQEKKDISSISEFNNNRQMIEYLPARATNTLIISLKEPVFASLAFSELQVMCKLIDFRVILPYT